MGLVTSTTTQYLTYSGSSSGIYKKPVKMRETGKNIIISEVKSPIYIMYTMAIAMAVPTKDMMIEPIVFPGKQDKELVEPPKGLPTPQEAEGWLKATESTFDFWDNEEDSIYDDF